MGGVSSWRAFSAAATASGGVTFSLRAASRARTFLRAPGAGGERKDGRSIVLRLADQCLLISPRESVRRRAPESEANAISGVDW